MSCPFAGPSVPLRRRLSPHGTGSCSDSPLPGPGSHRPAAGWPARVPCPCFLAFYRLSDPATGTFCFLSLRRLVLNGSSSLDQPHGPWRSAHDPLSSPSLLSRTLQREPLPSRGRAQLFPLFGRTCPCPTLGSAQVGSTSTASPLGSCDSWCPPPTLRPLIRRERTRASRVPSSVWVLGP